MYIPNRAEKTLAPPYKFMTVENGITIQNHVAQGYLNYQWQFSDTLWQFRSLSTSFMDQSPS
jgi:hypothetical protein